MEGRAFITQWNVILPTHTAQQHSQCKRDPASPPHLPLVSPHSMLAQPLPLPVLSCAELTEILSSLRYHISEQLRNTNKKQQQRAHIHQYINTSIHQYINTSMEHRDSSGGGRSGQEE